MIADDHIDPLTRLAIRHGTDKWGPHFYTPIYHELLAPLRDRPVKLLEIGVGGYGFRKIGGASLAMWADYFQWGTIIGLDVAEKKLDLGPRVTILQGSQADPGFLSKLAIEQGPFDIIIDDGSHVAEHVVLSFNKLFPAVVDDGYYIIEDVQTAFWPAYGGSPNGGGETLRLAQAILEGLNHVEVRAAAANWSPLPGTDRIKSFRAYHNVFVIEKGDNSEPSTQNLDNGNSHVVSRACADRTGDGASTNRGWIGPFGIDVLVDGTKPARVSNCSAGSRGLASGLAIAQPGQSRCRSRRRCDHPDQAAGAGGRD